MVAEIFSAYDLIIVLVVLLLVFGATKLPQLARSLGSASHEFKKGLDEGAKSEGAKGEGDDGATTDTGAPSEKAATSDNGAKAESDGTASSKG